MTSNDPDQIRQEIERTRADLSTNVNTLADSVSPSSVAKRQTDKVRGAVFGARDKVMGSSSDAVSGLKSTQSSVSGAVSDAPDQLRAKTSGNPFAAGLIAFGVGWLAASLLPASAAEQRAAGTVKDTATPLITDTAKDVADHLKEPAQQAVAAVRDTASDAAATVQGEGSSAAQDLKSQAQDAKESVTQ